MIFSLDGLGFSRSKTSSETTDIAKPIPAHRAGYLAAIDGLQDNPFEASTADHADWQRGFTEGTQDKAW